ncbi:MAG: hypothetical protein HGA23_01885 [Bacteroidales bacterium]|nr:hypothetical protein [Bacteroidales bacterium]
MKNLQRSASLEAWLCLLKKVTDKHEKLIVNTAIFFVLACFLITVSGCNYYTYTTKKNSTPDQFIKSLTDEIYTVKKYPRDLYPDGNLAIMLMMDRDFYVYNDEGRWHLNNPVMKGDTITGNVQYAPIPRGDPKQYVETRPSRKYIPSTERIILKRINFHVTDVTLKDTSKIDIPVSNIMSCDIFQKDKKKTTSRAFGTFFLVVGGLATIFLILAIIALSSSCPFVYVYDGKDWQFTGEMYGGAAFPVLERMDYLLLPKFNTGPGSAYQIKVANMLKEIQHINMAGLLILQHDSTVYPLIDKYGNVQTIVDPISPVTACNSKGKDCLEPILEKDYLTHDFCEALDTAVSNNYFNNLELTFKSGSAPQNAKLYLNLKNSLWADRLMREFYELFGKRYEKFMKKQEKQPADFHYKWMKEQGLLLQVSVMKDGTWQPADFFNMAGAFGIRDMVLPLDLQDAWVPDNPDNTSFTAKIRLESGYNFWQVDYAALDMTENVPVGQTLVQPDYANDQDGKDVKQLLTGDDELYLVQNKTGDEVQLGFTLPETTSPYYTLYLLSKGYYQQADIPNHDPAISLLETFREPGQLSLWSFRNYETFRTEFEARIIKVPDHE